MSVSLEPLAPVEDVAVEDPAPLVGETIVEEAPAPKVEESTAPAEQPEEPPAPAPNKRGRPKKYPAAKAKAVAPEQAVRMKPTTAPYS